MLISELKKTIREVPDFPKPGINFYDLTTLFANAEAFAATVDRLVERYTGDRLTMIAGIEARGFLLAAAMARSLELGVVMIRKPGKLPWETEAEEYTLEYGKGRLEIHRDAVGESDRVLIVDDVLATGGTAAAGGRLVERLGARIEGYAFLVELAFLNGRKLLDGSNVFSLLQYD